MTAPRGASRPPDPDVSKDPGPRPARRRERFRDRPLELPGSGDRPRLPDVDQSRVHLREAMADDSSLVEIIDWLILPLVEPSVPEWQSTIDALLELPGIRGPVGVSGGLMAVALRLAATDPLIKTVGLFAGTAHRWDARRDAPPPHAGAHAAPWDDEMLRL